MSNYVQEKRNESNGIIFIEDGKIVSELVIDDIEPTHWHPLPELPNKTP